MAFAPQPYKSEYRPGPAVSAGASVPLAGQAMTQASQVWQPPKLAKRPKHLLLAQTSAPKAGDEASMAVPYSVMVALILGGIAVGLLAHKHRDHAFGGIVFGAAASVTGVGFTLLIVELVK